MLNLNSRLPFDIQKPILYESFYAFFVISMIPYINPIIAMDTLFMGLSLQISALFTDLQGQALNIEFGQLYKGKYENETNLHSFVERIRRFVQNHNDIIDLVDQMENIFGGIFVVQYVGAIVSLCTQAYLSTLVSLCTT